MNPQASKQWSILDSKFTLYLFTEKCYSLLPGTSLSHSATALNIKPDEISRILCLLFNDLFAVH